MNQEDIIVGLKTLHRDRRYAMKLQQKIDRALESYIKLHATDWTPDLSEEEREKINKQVKKIIETARKGQGEPFVIKIVTSTDQTRHPADTIRKDAEREMEKLAKELPIYAWTQSITGAGALGLATIIAETGDLAGYPKGGLSKEGGVVSVWKRLGFHNYEGVAGSTWKREKWRPRTLTADEWIANPFSGKRYALIHQIAIWLVNAQVEGAEKSGTEFGKPIGPYGEIYVRRRETTKITHPDWSKQHARMDAIRVTMKLFLRDLWCQWNGRAVKTKFSGQCRHDTQIDRAGDIGSDQSALVAQTASIGAAPAGHAAIDTQPASPRRGTNSKTSRRHTDADIHKKRTAGNGARSHPRVDTHKKTSARATKKSEMRAR